MLDGDAPMEGAGIIFFEFAFYAVLMFGLMGVPLWRICSRAGFNPAWSLFVLIPYLGMLIVAGRLAISDWPKFSHQQKNEA
jgi:hypothetical protein